MVMFIEMAANTAILVKPAVPALWSAMMVYLIGYQNVSKIVKIKSRAAGMAADICHSSSKLFLVWLFLKQFIFADANIRRFDGSVWFPLIESIFR